MMGVGWTRSDVGSWSSLVSLSLRGQSLFDKACRISDLYSNMKDLLALLALLYVLPALAQPAAPYNPDADGNGIVGAADLLPFLEFFGMPFEPEAISCQSAEFNCGDSLAYHGHYYHTVNLAGECWFEENLRTAQYANGDSIATNLNHSEWYTSETGLTAIYGEGETTCETISPDFDACDPTIALEEYGRLYNWYAVNDARGLCPGGWHVSSQDEFTAFLDFYCPEEGDGAAAKSLSGWSLLDFGANGTNRIGFNGLPGGSLRADTPEFFDEGESGIWWTSTLSTQNIGQAYIRSLAHNSTDMCCEGADRGLSGGVSVRCVKSGE